MVEQKQKTELVKKSSYLVEKLFASLFITSISYSFFFSSYIGWIIMVAVTIIYLFYKITKKNPKDQISKFEQFKRNRKMNAERKRREKMERESLERQNKEMELKEKIKLKSKSNLKKNKSLEKENELVKKEKKVDKKINSKKIGKESNGIAKELKKSVQLIDDQSFDSKEKNPRLNDLEIEAVDIDKIKSELSKNIAKDLTKTSDKTIEEANKLAKEFVNNLDLNKITNYITGVLMLTGRKAIKMVFDVVTESAKEVFDNVIGKNVTSNKKLVNEKNTFGVLTEKTNRPTKSIDELVINKSNKEKTASEKVDEKVASEIINDSLKKGNLKETKELIEDIESQSKRYKERQKDAVLSERITDLQNNGSEKNREQKKWKSEKDLLGIKAPESRDIKESYQER